MTERDPRPAERLTPAQAEAVRRLLAAARHDEGIPDEVAARLDSTITDLAAERVEAAAGNDETPGAGEAVVIPFRRRRWPQVLVAAAAVTVFGFGTAQIVGTDSGDDAGTTSADNAVQPEVATSEDFGSDGAGDDTSSGSAGPPRSSVDNLTGGSLELDPESLRRLGIKDLRQLTRGTLASDLDELLRESAAEGGRDTASGYDARAVADHCGPYYSVTGGETFVASYRRHLALVLFHPELDGVRLVEIYDCESATPRQTVRTVTLKTGE
jgi:hypothetical protein